MGSSTALEWRDVFIATAAEREIARQVCTILAAGVRFVCFRGDRPSIIA
jgi:hypothetical protein